MSSNTELIKGAYAAFGRGDIPAVIDLVDDEVEWTSPTTLPQGGQFHGKGGVGQFFEGVGGAWSDLSLELECVCEGGPDLVIGVVRADGTLRAGSKSGYGATHLFTITSGKVTRFREYVDLDGPLS